MNPNTTKSFIPLNKRSKEAARAIQVKGGIARGRQQTLEKEVRRTFQTILMMDAPPELLELVRGYLDDKLEEQRKLLYVAFARRLEKAIKHNDPSAFRDIMEYSGLSTPKLQVSGDPDAPLNAAPAVSVEQIVELKKALSDDNK